MQTKSSGVGHTRNIEELKDYIKNKKPLECFHCGRMMKQQIDSITKKKSEYLYACDCPDFPKGMVLSIG